VSAFDAARSGRSLVGSLAMAAGLASTLAVLSGFAAARTEGPFAKFSGAWRGAGEVIGADGTRERISCRARYDVAPGGAELSQSLVCASDSYRFDVRTSVVAQGQNVQGRWEEVTRNVSGDVSGQVGDGDFEGSVAGFGFTAELSLKLSGRKQAVLITPHGGDIAKVDIVLSHER